MPTPTRLLPVAAALCLVLDPLAAAATSALFHFDDFDYSGPYEGPEFDAPYTYLYGCEGKPYCTGRDIVRTNGDGDDDPASPVSTVRNGIGMVIDRYGFTMTLNYDADSGWADVGNSPNDFTLFLLDFDTPLHSFAAEIERPRVLDSEYCERGDECPPDPTRVVQTLVQVYLWSEPGGTGDLVGSLTITPDDDFDRHLALVSDLPFRSVNIGHALSDDPGCIVGDLLPCGYDRPNHGSFSNGYVIGHILVDTVPEPSTAILLGLGLIGLAARSRRR